MSSPKSTNRAQRREKQKQSIDTSQLPPQQDLYSSLRSPLYMYNYHIRKEGDPILSLPEYKKMLDEEQALRAKRRSPLTITDTTPPSCT